MINGRFAMESDFVKVFRKVNANIIFGQYCTKIATVKQPRCAFLQQFRSKKSPAYTELTTYLLLSSPGNFSNVLLQRCYSRLKDTLPQMTRAVGSTLKLGGRPRLIPQKTSRNNVRFRFLTPLLTHFVREFFTYNVCFFRVILAPVPIIKSDVINGRSSILGWA